VEVGGTTTHCVCEIDHVQFDKLNRLGGGSLTKLWKGIPTPRQDRKPTDSQTSQMTVQPWLLTPTNMTLT